MVTAHERHVLRTDPGKIELAGHERGQLDHRLIHDGDDEPLDVRRPAHIGWKIDVPVEHPAAVRLVCDETEWSITHRVDVPRSLAQAVVRHAVEQVRRQNREIGEDERQIVRGVCEHRSRELQLDGRVVQRGD